MGSPADPVFEKTTFEDSNFVARDETEYPAAVLRAAADAQKCRPYKLPLRFIDLDVAPWSGHKTIYWFVEHSKRVAATNLEHPVLLTPEGYIADGWHRVVKAFLEGEDHVMALRLREMPEKEKEK